MPDAKFISAQAFDSPAFYQDQHWLAINPNTTKTATASYTFKGTTGNYDVVLFTVGENDGRSTYSVRKNNTQFGWYSPALSTSTFEEGPEYTKVFEAITLKQGDNIQVVAGIGSQDQKEFSRGRWSGIALTQAGKGKRLLAKIKAELAAKTPLAITGELKKWHKVTLTFDGPESAEDATDNPFMNYRLNIVFTHVKSGKSYVIPGYFAADGNAGETSATAGNKWRAHFAPDEIGEWEFKVDFRKANFSAVSNKPETGKSAGFMDGYLGSFAIAPTDKTGNDFRAKGRLQYIGKRYLQFAETGEYFLKQGADAPENFLAYADFDGTFHNDGHKDHLVKTWKNHLQDWKKGDPTWQNGKGKAMIGALNYLASKGLNAFSFLTNNIAGDDQNVFPYVDYDTWDRIDVSKMDQWEVVFCHAQQLGLFLHFKTLEVENQGLLDNGGVGANSKLYYRELMARFGHHLALNWNLCEENGEWVKNPTTPPQSTQERLAMAHYFKENDPYHHHLVIHNGIPYDDLLGPESGITGPSVQTHRADFSSIHKEVLHWLNASEEAGFPWAVAVDEPGDAQHSLLPDAEDPNHDMARRNGLWGTLMAGGWGNEWYFGYAHAHSDLTCEDYRSRDLFWDQAKIALDFFKQQQIAVDQLENNNQLVGNTTNNNSVYCLAKPNQLYVVYKNNIERVSLDLSQTTGEFSVQWYNPKVGGVMQNGNVKKVVGGSKVDLGKAPNKKQEDWVILLKKV
ncbi:DUF5060 domain-containing protein [Croceivirga sp. JEA036]|nr:DUF5060 domain-containing protein [Croceivirga sp. JEA036]